MMKQGVVYDKKLGFKLDPATDIELAVRTISAALGEEVELTVRCFLCGTEACPGCPYIEICDRSRVSSLCLCEKHSPEKDVYELYQKTLRRQRRSLVEPYPLNLGRIERLPVCS